MYRILPTINALGKRPVENVRNEKLLVIFIFSINIFYPINEKLHCVSKLKLSSANAFNLDKAKILSSAKEFTLKSMTQF